MCINNRLKHEYKTFDCFKMKTKKVRARSIPNKLKI